MLYVVLYLLDYDISRLYIAFLTLVPDSKHVIDLLLDTISSSHD